MNAEKLQLIASLQAIHPILMKFIEGMLEKNEQKMKSCLHPDGDYQIVDEKRKKRELKSADFLQWFMPIVHDKTIRNIEFDQCNCCMMGNHVLLINEGKFPFQEKIASFPSKNGLAFLIENDLIVTIKLCTDFQNTQNDVVHIARLKQEVEDKKHIQKCLKEMPDYSFTKEVNHVWPKIKSK